MRDLEPVTLQFRAINTHESKLSLQVALAMSTIAILGWATATFAQQPNYFCFMRDSSGQVVDLSATICGLQQTQKSSKAPVDPADSKKASSSAIDLDAAFWQEFSGALKDVQARQTADLVGRAETTALAKEVCQTLDAGNPLPSPTEQANRSRYPASYFEAINTAAVKTYCPQYQSKLKG